MFLQLLAQVPPIVPIPDSSGIPVADIPQLVTMVTSVGFAVWYAYHLTVSVIPKMQEAAGAERLALTIQAAKDRDTAAIAAATERQEMKAAATIERTELLTRYDAALDKVIAHCKEDMALIVAENKQVAKDLLIESHKPHP